MAAAPLSSTVPAMTESIWFTDALLRVHVTPEDTDGAFALIETLAPSGHTTPPHIHEDYAESALVLEGELTVHTLDGPTVVRPGQSVHIPAGTAHTLSVTSAGPMRAVLVSAPSGFVDFIRAAGRPAERDALPVVDGPPDLELIARASAANRTTVLGPLGALPADVITEAR